MWRRKPKEANGSRWELKPGETALKTEISAKYWIRNFGFLGPPTMLPKLYNICGEGCPRNLTEADGSKNEQSIAENFNFS